VHSRVQIFAVLLAALVLASCGHGGASHGDARRIVRIEERDFTIKSPHRLTAGDVRLVVENHGPDEHELIIVRVTGGPLPLRGDGQTVDEDAVEPLVVGILEPGAPGRSRTLDLYLSVGRYELICNMSGHFLGGMHTYLDVA
jgi:hypothetical protein